MKNTLKLLVILLFLPISGNTHENHNHSVYSYPINNEKLILKDNFQNNEKSINKKLKEINLQNSRDN